MKEKTIVIYAECRNPKTKGEKKLAINIALSIIKRNTGHKIVLSGQSDTLSVYVHLSEKSLPDNKIMVEGTEVNLTCLDEINPELDDIVLYIEVNRCKPCPIDKLQQILNPDTRIVFIGTPKWAGYDLDTFLKESSKRAAQTVPSLLEKYLHEEKKLSFFPTGIGPATAGLPRLPKHHEHTSELTQYFSDKQYGFIYAKHTTERDYVNNDIPPREKDIQFILDYIKLSLLYMNPTEPYHFVLIGAHDSILEELLSRCQSFLSQKFKLQLTMESSDPERFSDSVLNPLDVDEARAVSHQTIIESNMGSSMHFFSKVTAADMRYLCNHAIPFVAMTGTQSALEAAESGKIFLYQYLKENKAFSDDFKNTVFSEIDNHDFSPEIKKNMMSLINLLINKISLDEEQKAELVELLSDETLCANLCNIYQKLVNKASDTLTDKIIEQLETSTTPDLTYI